MLKALWDGFDTCWREFIHVSSAREESQVALGCVLFLSLSLAHHNQRASFIPYFPSSSSDSFSAPAVSSGPKYLERNRRSCRLQLRSGFLPGSRSVTADRAQTSPRQVCALPLSKWLAVDRNASRWCMQTCRVINGHRIPQRSTMQLPFVI